MPEQPNGSRLPRDFLKLWGGQTCSIFGSLVGRIALPFLVIYTLQATPAQVALVRAAEVAPGMIIGLVAGVWIDRLRRKPVMIWADVGRALLTISIPAALWLGHLSLSAVLVVSSLLSVMTVCFDIAYESYLPTLVEPQHVVEANSRLSATASAAEVTGFGVAGALYQLIGAGFTIAIDAVSFVVSAVTLAWIRRPEPPPAPAGEREPVLREAREGLKVLAGNPLLLTLGGVAGLSSIYHGMLGTVYVLYISRNLAIAPGVQGVLYAMGGISSFLGAAAAAPLLRRLGLGPALAVTSVLGLAGILLVPAAAGPYWLILAFLVAQQLLGDGAETVYQIHVTSTRQTVTPGAFLGRVNATWRVASWMFELAGTLVSGILAEQIGLRETFFLAVGIRALSSLWLLVSPVRRMKAVPDPAP